MALLRAVLLSALAITLIAAPCRNCVPSSAPARQAHDCCPKPAAPAPCHRPAESPCKWAPAETGIAVEKRDAVNMPDVVAYLGPASVPEPAALAAPMPAALSIDPSPPPSRLSTVLRR